VSFDPNAEWLEADGLGGFASGAVSGIRTRRYHALLLHAATPPSGRIVLVNGFDAWIETPAGRFALSSQAYEPEVVHPDGASHLVAFARDPWPRWTFSLPDGTRVEQELFVPHERAAVVVAWRVTDASGAVALEVRPFLSGRDYHALHHENGAFRFEPESRGDAQVWRAYDGVPAVWSRANGRYEHAPHWYRRFRYDAERERGLDWSEDLASPGAYRFDLAAGEAVWTLGADASGPDPRAIDAVRDAERARRDAFPSPLHRAADAYVVRRGAGRTLVAGYPWFTDWGRDTFISLRGVALATGRLDVAREIVLEWAAAVSDGMLPNRFADHGETPEYNAVDASLWYVIAGSEWLAAAGDAVTAADRLRFERAADAILEGYAKGTRYGIRADADGLLASGAPGVQLTWMDAKVGDWVVTPRRGKPVEVQALWINALRLAGARRAEWAALADRATASFHARFWNEERGALFDVLDVDGVAGAVDPAFRPNQLFAIGGLPFALLDGERARRVVDAVEEKLWTPLGLRSLAPDEAEYTARYAGGVRERDGAYHRGTVWPWLAGAFVEAWLRVRGGSDAAKRAARERFFAPLCAHVETAGLGHVSEIADAEAPHAPRGCPFQAWSLGELLRIEALLR